MPLLSPLPSPGKNMQVRLLFSMSHYLEVICSLKIHQYYSEIRRKTKKKLKICYVLMKVIICLICWVFLPLCVFFSFKSRRLCWKDIELLPPWWVIECGKGEKTVICRVTWKERASSSSWEPAVIKDTEKPLGEAEKKTGLRKNGKTFLHIRTILA